MIAAQTDAQSVLVGSNGVYSGLVTRDKIECALHSGAAEAPITTIATDNCAHVHPDHPLELLLDRLAKNPGLLPVVSRSQVNRVEGVITPQTLVQFVQEKMVGPKDSGE